MQKRSICKSCKTSDIAPCCKAAAGDGWNCLAKGFLIDRECVASQAASCSNSDSVQRLLQSTSAPRRREVGNGDPAFLLFGGLSVVAVKQGAVVDSIGHRFLTQSTRRLLRHAAQGKQPSYTFRSSETFAPSNSTLKPAQKTSCAWFCFLFEHVARPPLSNMFGIQKTCFRTGAAFCRVDSIKTSLHILRFNSVHRFGGFFFWQTAPLDKFRVESRPFVHIQCEWSVDWPKMPGSSNVQRCGVDLRTMSPTGSCLIL